MKHEFAARPSAYTEAWPGQLSVFSWHDFLTAIPSPLFLVTSYKANGKENACLESWATFVGENGIFFCILAAVNKHGHLYATLKETGCCVINFPSRDIYDRCYATVANNGYDVDEITQSGLTAEPAISVKAPRVRECFLNIECEVEWEHELFANSREVTIALRATHICMDSDHYGEGRLGRYGKTGYLYNIHSPRDPETGDVLPDCFGILEKML